MSILIKGMEMPKNCAKCFVGFCKQIGCEHYIGFDDHDRARHPDCPLIEVPEPHGRLIDADAALKNIKPIKPEDQRKGCTIETTKRLMMSLINRTPTVIPAEEGGA